MGDNPMAVGSNNSTAEKFNNVFVADGFIQCSHLFFSLETPRHRDTETPLRSAWILTEDIENYDTLSYHYTNRVKLPMSCFTRLILLTVLSFL